jgi:S-adenosylmethionine-diacylgycerolhomoserine-N-methlytransferase
MKDTRSDAHARLMNNTYRWQRHFYDVTRKFFLLGRDQLLNEFQLQPGQTALEIGCGTGRNLVMAAQLYPDATIFGLDISTEMLKSARASIRANCFESRVHLACGDAAAFDASRLLGMNSFDCVFFSYSLSMIPSWRDAVMNGIKCMSASGSVHILDFGQQERFPTLFRKGLTSWLALFHVYPRVELADELKSISKELGLQLRLTSMYRGYAWMASLRRR